MAILKNFRNKLKFNNYPILYSEKRIHENAYSSIQNRIKGKMISLSK